MKKISLKEAAEQFEMIGPETHLFYNTETGEFNFYSDWMDDSEDEFDEFEDEMWIAAPSQYEIGEYDIMVEFAEAVTDPRKNELLCVALGGRGSFRRFKDTLHRVDLLDEWYQFKHEAFVRIARRWCEENGIEYVEEEKKPNTQTPPESTHSVPDDNTYTSNTVIIPLTDRITDDAAEILRQVFPGRYSGNKANQEIKRMLSKKRIALAAITDTSEGLCVTGIIGAVPQYGTTGWELHPLAVSKEYRGYGIGRLLVQCLESDVVERGGVMLHLSNDDRFGNTSLYGADLYDDLFGKLKDIQNKGEHPYSFYEKMGYSIVGVLPDANGIGKPIIWMAKRL